VPQPAPQIVGEPLPPLVPCPWVFLDRPSADCRQGRRDVGCQLLDPRGFAASTFVQIASFVAPSKATQRQQFVQVTPRP
jgi:hypothetical protein